MIKRRPVKAHRIICCRLYNPKISLTLIFILTNWLLESLWASLVPQKREEGAKKHNDFGKCVIWMRRRAWNFLKKSWDPHLWTSSLLCEDEQWNCDILLKYPFLVRSIAPSLFLYLFFTALGLLVNIYFVSVTARWLEKTAAQWMNPINIQKRKKIGRWFEI